MNKEGSLKKKYSAPALEKGLDILELLAQQTGGLNQLQIAERLGRSINEIYRMLACLEQRGYIHRNPVDDLYYLTLKVFELSHRFPPTRRLLEIALPVMRRLAAKTGQSCHAAVIYNQNILVMAMVESPGVMGFSVRVGAMQPIEKSASGRLLLACGLRDFSQENLQSYGILLDEKVYLPLKKHLEEIRERGYECLESDVLEGIMDISYPIYDHMQRPVAALTIPCLIPRGERGIRESVRLELEKAAMEICEAMGANNKPDSENGE